MITTALNASLPSTVRTRDGLSLHTRHWPVAAGVTPQGVALIVHGLGEHAARYDHVAAALNAIGWAAVSYDHRGHGRSEGARGKLAHDDDLLHDLGTMVDATRAAYPGQRLLMIGHSMGGAVAGRFVAAQAKPAETAEAAAWARPVDALVLSSPALALPMSALQKLLLATVGQLTPDVAVPNGLKPEWVCHNPETVRAYLADPLVHDRITGRLTRWMKAAGETARARAATWTVPTLLMWGGEDRCVDPQGSVAFAAQAPQALLTAHPWPRLSHEIFNEREQAEVLSVMCDWVQQHLGSPT